MKKLLLSLITLCAFTYAEAAPSPFHITSRYVAGQITPVAAARAVVPGAAICYLIGRTPQAQLKARPTNDSLHIKPVPHAFSWHGRPTAFTARADGFTVKAGKGTDLYCSLDGSFYANNVPKLLFTPDKDFIFSARLQPAFAAEYDAGAVMIYTDSSNWAKVLVERLGDGTLMIGSSIVNNRITDDSYHVAVSSPAVHLKLARSGKTYCFYYSVDGRTWKLLRTFSFPRPEGMRIGFYAQSPRGDGLLLDVSDIRYKAVAFKDFFAGE